MALDIQQIRNYDRTGSLAISDAAQGPAQIVKTGFWHAFGSMIHWGSSVDKNTNTLNALRTAIQNDPRYFAEDVQSRAAALLDGVRTDRAIGVAKIKSIIAALDEMSTPSRQRQTIVNVAGGHLAATGLPPEAAGMETQYKNMAQMYAAGDPGEGRTYADINIADRLEEFRQTFGRVLGRVGDDPLARELFATFVQKRVLVKDNGAPKSEEEMNAIADEIRQMATGLAAFGEKYGNVAKVNVIDILRASSKPIRIDTITAVFEKGRNFPKADLCQLKADSSVADIHKAVLSVANSIKGILEGLPFEPDDPFANQLAQEIASMGVASALSPDERKNLFAAFKSEQGKNLLQFYISNDNGTLQSSIVNAVFGMVSLLNTEIDGASPRQFVELPEEIDYLKIPADITYEIAPGDIASGKVGKEIVAGLARGIGIVDLDEEAAKKMSNRFSAITKNALIVHLAQQFNGLRDGKITAKTGKPDFSKENENFNLDLDRGFSINVVVGGEKRQLPADNPKVARDMLTQFVLGDDKATFEGADEKTKAKVHMLMAMANQGVNAAVQDGVAEGFEPDATGNAITCATPDYKTTITFSLNANNDVETDFTLLMDQNVKMTTKGKSSQYSMSMHFLGAKSFVEYKAHITLPKGDMEKFANAKWEEYDHGQAGELAQATVLKDRKEMAANAVPEEFKFTGDVKVYFRIHADTEVRTDMM